MSAMTIEQVKKMRPLLEYFYFCGVCYGNKVKTFEGMGDNFESKFKNFIKTMESINTLKNAEELKEKVIKFFNEPENSHL